MISSIDQKNLKGSDEYARTIREYRQTIEIELEKVCQDILDVLCGYLIPNAKSSESKILYYKMYDYPLYL